MLSHETHYLCSSSEDQMPRSADEYSSALCVHTWMNECKAPKDVLYFALFALQEQFLHFLSEMRIPDNRYNMQGLIPGILGRTSEVFSLDVLYKCSILLLLLTVILDLYRSYFVSHAWSLQKIHRYCKLVDTLCSINTKFSHWHHCFCQNVCPYSCYLLYLELSIFMLFMLCVCVNGLSDVSLKNLLTYLRYDFSREHGMRRSTYRVWSVDDLYDVLGLDVVVVRIQRDCLTGVFLPSDRRLFYRDHLLNDQLMPQIIIYLCDLTRLRIFENSLSIKYRCVLFQRNFIII